MTRKNKKQKWPILKRTCVYKNKWRQVKKYIVLLPNKKKNDFYSVEYIKGVNVLGITKDGKIILIKQYNFLTNRYEIEVVGGVLEQNEKPSNRAKKELLEETGYRVGKIIPLGKAKIERWTTKYDYFYLALDCYKSTEQNLEPAEDIQVYLVDFLKLKELISKDKIKIFSHLVCILKSLNYLKLINYDV